MFQQNNSNTNEKQKDANKSVFDVAFQTSRSDRIQQVAQVYSNFRDLRGTDTNQRVSS